ncbi:two-component sensor histidine kinase [Microbacterium sorbitolivorans]|uniref:histidine kinase n=1 Tax=Microbacterium sorbitolivorans TaxID=1867410 RepID=A0A367Y2T2_9MICO|nr:histidine kinase [Microbacterium sorbitolivorans]RCK60137.1 ATPase [Microbacterium sorbitolivorans]GGF48117.1 two-component sensor histidine kinase [Microbacterium sorbitolivorans]
MISPRVELATYLVFAAGFGYLSVESELVTPPWAIALLCLGGVATVRLRRRDPTAALGVALILLLLSAAGGTGAEAILVGFALLGAGAIRSVRWTWTAYGFAAATGTLAALILSLRVRSGPPILGLAPRVDQTAWATDWLSLSAVFMGITLITTLAGLNIGHRRRHIASLIERAEQMRRERDQQADIARALERERIAREMHDVIAHSLSVMISLADGAKAAAPGKPEEARRVIGQVADTGRRTLGEVRRLLGQVRNGAEPQADTPLLGPEQLPELVADFATAGLPVRLEREGRLRSDTAVELTVYRIVQESLTNVLRHARQVRNVLVRIDAGDETEADEVTILVEDQSAPVQGLESRVVGTNVPGRGLLGIRERAALYDGLVEAGPRDGGGWRVFVRLRTEER